MKKRAVYSCLLALWAFFSVFGVAVFEKSQTVDKGRQEFVSLAGLDGDVYLTRYCNPYSIFRMRKRHPGEVIAAAPWYVVGTTVAAKAGEKPAKIAQILLSAALAVATAWLLWLVVSDWSAVVLWLSFAYVWLLAAAPELFAVSQAVLVGTLLMVRRGVKDVRAWAGAALFAGAVTITNGIKPIAAVVAAHGIRGQASSVKKHMRQLAGIVLGVVALAVTVEVCKWMFIDHKTPMEEFAMGWDYIVRWSASGYGWSERLARTWEMFFCEPLMTHGRFFGCANEILLDELPLGYGSAVPHVVIGVMAALCGWGAWKGRGEPVVRAALAMVTFDVLLHVIVGWGLVEAQIYCGHWMFVIPVVLSQLPGRWWKVVLALAIAAWNVQFAGRLVLG